MLTLIADRFRVLGDPGRLLLLNALRQGERTVTDLVNETGLAQASVSKHMQQLYAVGLVVRRKEGLFVHYSIRDARVYRMCDLMCDQLRKLADQRHRILHRSA